MDNKVLVILGMHRSGTSLTAQWLHACGLDIGDRLLSDDFSNKNGHYEDLDFLELHKLILSMNKLKETGLEGDLSKIKLNNYLKQKIRHTCLMKNELKKQWSWKEPRTCLFIDEYEKILPNLKVLVVFRDLSEVRTSLVKREITKIIMSIHKMPIINKIKWKLFKKYYIKKWNSLKNDMFLKTSIFYHEKIIDFIENFRKRDLIVCDLKTLMKKDKTVINKIQAWGFDLEYIEFNSVYDNTLLNKREDYLSRYDSMTEEEKVIYIKLQKYAI